MSHLQFALDVHRAVSANPREPLCWSPFSVASALGLLAHGAAGETRAQLLGLLGDLDELTALLARASRLDDPGYDEQRPVIAVSNTLWADARIRVEQAFAEQLAAWPGGSVRNAPFQAEPEKARQAINADVAETTRRLISELIPPGAIRSDTVSALVNALYLRGAWRSRFTEGATVPRPFHAPAGTVEVPTMRLESMVGYAATDGWQVVALPAAGGVEAIVLLPDADLAGAEPRLTAQSLATLLAAPGPQQLLLYLPRIKIKTSAELSGPVRALGVRQVFTDHADLRAMSPDPLYAQQILHESVLKIDEQGLEGAAATAIMIGITSFSPPPRPVIVTVDRPFLLLVRQQRTGAVYFLARVTDPGRS